MSFVFDTGSVFELFDVFNDSEQLMGWRSKEMRAKGFNALLKAAILGMRWTVDDASAVNAWFKMEGRRHRFSIDEKALAEAQRCGNKSACASIEAFLNDATERVLAQRPDGIDGSSGKVAP